MTGNVANRKRRIHGADGTDCRRKLPVLIIGVAFFVRTLEFDAQGKIIATRAPSKSGVSCVPGTAVKGNELHYRTVTPNQQVRRYLQAANLLEIRVRIPVQAIGEQLLDFWPAVATGRQADAVNHD